MENFTFYAPTYFVFGKKTEEEAGKYIKKFGGKNVLIHYGKGSVIKVILVCQPRNLILTATYCTGE